jgi:hypothetical protein
MTLWTNAGFDEGQIWNVLKAKLARRKHVECKKIEIADAKDMPRALAEVMHDLTWKSEGVSESFIARVHLNGRLQENPDVEIFV